MAPLTGTWEKLPGRVVDMASTSDALVLAEGPEDGGPLRVHVARRRGAAWAWQEPWCVPAYPGWSAGGDLPESATLAVAEDDDGLHVAVTRVEDQGGSYGIALATLTRAGWGDETEIASPTDQDIPFGQPLRRLAREVFTFESDEALWHYVRAGASWDATSIALRRDSVQCVCPPMALASSGLLVAANEDADGRPVLLAYQSAHSARRRLERLELPATVEAMSFVGEVLYLGFRSPAPGGAAVWAVSLSQTPRLEPLQRITVPAPSNPAWLHVAGLDASAEWLLVLQLDDAWLAPATGAATMRQLELPPSRRGDRACRRPRGVLLGSLAVLIVEDMLGTFTLTG